MFNKKQASFDFLRKIFIEERKPVIFWLGAGVSADAGLPGWDTLRSHLYDAAMERIREISGIDGDEAEAAVEYSMRRKDLWGAFSVLKEYSGETTYKETIRKYISPKEGTAPPEVLRKIWEIPQVKGVVTLNLDGLEEHAHRLVRQQELPDVFVGSKIKQHMNTIGSNRPFIARLHGHHSDFSSWVFTQEEISNLLRDTAYNTGVNLILTNSTVVFLGISAEDVAAGGFCQKLSDLDIDFGSHFWITNKGDIETSKWAEGAGIQKLVYSVSEGETHTSSIVEILNELTDGKSVDVKGDPVVINAEALDELPRPSEMRMLSEGDSRLLLNRHAKHLVESGGGTNNPAYAKFLRDYSLPVHQAWHISEIPGSDKYFDYRVVRKVSGSAFSNVWEVEDEKGEKFALKIVQLENLRSGVQLDSFRRGVQSQRLLGDFNSSTGFVRVKEAFEIPPSVIMEFVDGANLQELALQNVFEFWSDGLKIAINICNALISAHGSRHGVLHRDVRPSNIILPYFYFGECAKDFEASQYDVRLLNYDMSWHKDASGKVIPGNALEAGYYPPELLRHSQDEISRTTKVDSYGLGMTIYYMATKMSPPVAGSTASEWQEQLSRLRSMGPNSFPISGRILRRIVDDATHAVVSGRSTIHDIRSGIEELQKSIKEGVSGACIEHLTELLYNEAGGANYDVSAGGKRFSWDVISGRSIEMEANRSDREIRLLFTNKQSAQNNWKDIDKNWTKKLTSAKEIFQSGGWEVLPGTTYSSRTIHLGCRVKLDQVRNHYEKVADALRRGLDRVRID